MDAVDNSPWTFEGESAPLTTAGPLVTLVDGRCFSLSGVGGDISGTDPQGLFYLDTRLLKRFAISINDRSIEPLGHNIVESFRAQFVGRYQGPTRVADAPIVVFRTRTVGKGLTEEVKVHNFGDEVATLTVTAEFETDFAGLFEVKEGRAVPGQVVNPVVDGGGLRISTGSASSLEVRIAADPAPTGVQSGLLSWDIQVEPGAVWSTSVSVTPWLAGKPCRSPQATSPSAVQKLAAWQGNVPSFETNYGPLKLCTTQALNDVGSLRIFDPTRTEEPVIAAGAPWFMTLFGRDSLIAAWMSLLVDSGMSKGVLKTLARLQGADVNTETEEQPGRILHEVRFSKADSNSFDDGNIYYGTADATPLFVMLLAEVNRWAPDKTFTEMLLPHADRALDWIVNFGDVDGDGFVEYERSTVTGLENQGWKDSWDGIRYANGRVCSAPIALCEVQGYVYGAYKARADIASFLGDNSGATRWTEKAAEFKRAFNEQFWLKDRGYFAVGLDADKNPIDSLASNMGHCLWTGVVADDKAAAVAQRLLSTEMFSGWGLRTLSAANPGYNPTGYHTGSVWPHDTALAAAGLTQYGQLEESHRLIMALLACGQATAGRLPELLCGFDTELINKPIGYPASCSPQAWAAAAPLLMLRSIMRIEPDCANGTVMFDPLLPAEVLFLNIDNLQIAGADVSVRIEGGQSEIIGLPAHLSVTTAKT